MVAARTWCKFPTCTAIDRKLETCATPRLACSFRVHPVFQQSVSSALLYSRSLLKGWRFGGRISGWPTTASISRPRKFSRIAHPFLPGQHAGDDGLEAAQRALHHSHGRALGKFRSDLDHLLVVRFLPQTLDDFVVQPGILAAEFGANRKRPARSAPRGAARKNRSGRRRSRETSPLRTTSGRSRSGAENAAADRTLPPPPSCADAGRRCARALACCAKHTNEEDLAAVDSRWGCSG